jgi:hypothetical protein
MKSAKRTAPWRKTKLAAKWLSFTSDRRREHDGATPLAATGWTASAARDAGDSASTGANIFGYCMYLNIDYSAKP